MSNNFNKYQEGVRNVSFGNEYTNNPYPSQKQTLRGQEQAAPTQSEINVSVQEPVVQSIDASARQYHENLQTVTDNQLEQLHLTNMSDLEALTQSLK